MNHPFINNEFHDESVAIGLAELDLVTREQELAKQICVVYNSVFDAVDVCHAPCRDLLTHSDDTIVHFINAYSERFGLIPSRYDYDTETGNMSTRIHYQPSLNLLKYIRTIASTY